MAFTTHPLPASISKRIFQATLSDPDVPDGSAETDDDEEPGKSWDSSFDSDGQQSPLKSSKAEGQHGEATEEDSDSYEDDQQTPPNRTRRWKEYNRWLRSDNTDPEIMAFIRAELVQFNKKAGITSLPPRHYDCKIGNIYCDWMYRHNWNTNKGYMQNTTLLCPLVERCGCPLRSKN